ncbi:DNA modification methylase, partial [Escherichia coli]
GFVIHRLSAYRSVGSKPNTRKTETEILAVLK